MYQQQYQDEDSLDSENMRKVFAGSLDKSTTDETFGDYFSQFGEVLSSMVVRDQTTNESRGCGFVTYPNSDIVETVLKSRPHVIDNKTVDVKRAIPKRAVGEAARAKTLRLFVGGFRGIDLTTDDLQQYLESRHPTTYGTIDKIDLLKDRDTNELKGFGFITCSSFDFADRIAIAEMSFSLKGKRMSIKKAEERGDGGGNRERGGFRGGSYGGRGGGRGRGGRGESRYGGYNQGDRNNSYGNNYSNQRSSYGSNQGYGGQGGGGGGSWGQGSTRYQPY